MQLQIFNFIITIEWRRRFKQSEKELAIGKEQDDMSHAQLSWAPVTGQLHHFLTKILVPVYMHGRRIELLT